MIEIFKRKYGQTLAMVLLIKKHLEDGDSSHVLTKEKNVDRILKMLGDHGVKAKAEPMYVTPKMRICYNSDGIVGYDQPPKRQTGFKITRV